MEFFLDSYENYDTCPREKLILYVTYKFIKKNTLNYLNSSVYDIDDIINVCNEIFKLVRQ